MGLEYLTQEEPTRRDVLAKGLEYGLKGLGLGLLLKLASCAKDPLDYPEEAEAFARKQVDYLKQFKSPKEWDSKFVDSITTSEGYSRSYDIIEKGSFQGLEKIELWTHERFSAKNCNVRYPSMNLFFNCFYQNGQKKKLTVGMEYIDGQWMIDGFWFN